MTVAKDHTRHVLSAIHRLRDRFSEPVRITELASAARLSPSAFHRQFKSITSMTPLPYQKQLRLLEARRLMVTDGADVETAAFRVGYESPSQFSREYARLFGAPRLLLLQKMIIKCIISTKGCTRCNTRWGPDQRGGKG